MKFFIALVLALAVCGFVSAQQQPGGYTPIQWNANNQTLVSFLDFGVQSAVPEAIQAGQISQGNWDWTNVISVQTQVVDGMNYDFIVDIEDGTGDTARMDVIVYVAPDGSAMSLNSYAVFKM